MEPEIKEIKLDNKPQPVGVPSGAKFPLKKLFLVILGAVLFLTVVGAVVGVAVGLPAYKVYQDAMVAVASAKEIKDAAKEQDIAKISAAVAKTKGQMVTVQNNFAKLLWTKNILL